MKIGPKIILITAIAGVQMFQITTRAEDQPAFKDDKEKASYAIGLFFGNQIKSGNMEVDTDVIVSGMKDVLAGREPKLNQTQAREAITTYQQAARAKLAEKNQKTGEAFLAANKSKEGVHTKEVTLTDGKTAEFQYKVITEGEGSSPTTTEKVKVKYRGTLIDGTEFDSTTKRGGQPATFSVTGVVRGWSEALQMMKPGAKWELFIPSSLAYGENPRPGSGIEPGSTLVFEMELVSIDAPAQEMPAAPAKPLTSDIIRVPSAEEMKAGAKIEVIKASDLEKTNAANAAPKK